MRKYILVRAVFLLSFLIFHSLAFAQVINLGGAADFVLFSTTGAVTNTGLSHLTGNVGSNVGGSTGFGNVDGVMHNQDAATAQASSDLSSAYLQLNAEVPTFFPSSILGNGQTLNTAVYQIASNASLNATLILDAQGNANAIFIFQIEGTLNTNLNATVNLMNGAQACNVFWKVEGTVTLNAGTKMKGTIVANNGAITAGSGVRLEGHALSINGAIGVNGIRAFIPRSNLDPLITGPSSPVLATTQCFALFSGIGAISNVGTSVVSGDVGTNSDSPTGFNSANVVGTLHAIPDGITSQCATDFLSVYAYLSSLPYDIELIYPAQFGNSLVLTPHLYLLNAATTLTDSLILNAQGNSNAVFIFHVNGAFGSTSLSKIVLQNGAQAKNVYWLINGAITLGDHSAFVGTIISQGAIDLMSGMTLFGRALTGVGAISTTSVTTIVQTNCGPAIQIQPLNLNVCNGDTAFFSVTASGISLAYQWRIGLVNLVDGGNVSGATTSNLTLFPVANADASLNYNVVVSGPFIPVVYSNEVALNVQTGPLITSQPQSQTVCAGESYSFTVAAFGSSLTYQWQRNLVSLVDGPTVSGATTDTLSISGSTVMDSGTNYTVIISGGCILQE